MEVDREYILEYPLRVGRRESSRTTGGECERGRAGEASKAGGSCASSGGWASSLETLFADLVVDGALVLVAEDLEGFGDLGGVSRAALRDDERVYLFEFHGSLFRALISIGVPFQGLGDE